MSLNGDYEIIYIINKAQLREHGIYLRNIAASHIFFHNNFRQEKFSAPPRRGIAVINNPRHQWDRNISLHNYNDKFSDRTDSIRKR